MGDVVDLRKIQDVPSALVNIAESIKEGTFGEVKTITLILNDTVIQIGTKDTVQGNKDAVYNINRALHSINMTIDEQEYGSYE